MRAPRTGKLPEIRKPGNRPEPVAFSCQ